ncbi:MAG: hypothetical protein K9J13_14145 [Saprospiraceae bacterium]|nr:hypothetical protein [Saprospiraceae bacterium]
MSKQSQKYHLGMTGEYYVAAELNRRGISAAITYGNAKKADIVAIGPDESKSIVIEVKTTSKSNWIIGSRAPESSNKIWVLVHIPTNENEHPKYYVMFQSELHNILKPIEIEYHKRYIEKHGVEYGDKAGVCTLKRSLISEYEDAWEKIIVQFNDK